MHSPHFSVVGLLLSFRQYSIAPHAILSDWPNFLIFPFNQSVPSRLMLGFLSVSNSSVTIVDFYGRLCVKGRLLGAIAAAIIPAILEF